MAILYIPELMSARALIDDRIEMLERNAVEHDREAERLEKDAGAARAGAAEIRRHIALLRRSIVTVAD